MPVQVRAVIVQPFNLSTNLWGTALTATSTETFGSQDGMLGLAVDSNGNVVVLAYYYSSTYYAQYNYYNINNSTWDGWVSLYSGANSVVPSSVIVDSANRFTFAYISFATSTYPIIAQTLNSSKQLSAAKTIAASIDGNGGYPPSSPMCTFSISGTWYTGIITAAVTSAYVNFYYWANADSIGTVYGPYTISTAAANAMYMMDAPKTAELVWDGGSNLYCLFLQTSTQNVLYSQANVGTLATWSTPQFLAGGTNLFLNANYANNTVGFTYATSSSISYSNLSVPFLGYGAGQFLAADTLFSYGTNLYAIAIDNASGSYYASIMKSTDSGNTWNEMDSAHHPAVNATTGYRAASGGVASNGHLLWVVYWISGGIVLRAFDMSTDTWSSTVSSTVTAGFGSDFPVPFVQCAVRTDGTVVVLYNSYDVDWTGEYYFTIVGYAVYNPANNTFTVGGAAIYDDAYYEVDAWAYALGIDSADRCYFFFGVNGYANLYCNTLSSSNVLSANVTAASNFDQTAQGAQATTVVYSGTTYILVPYATTATGNPLAVAKAAIGASPSFTNVTVSGATVSDPELTTCPSGSLTLYNNVVYAFWADDTSQYGWTSVSNDGGATWSSPVEWITAGGMGAYSSTFIPRLFGIGVLYNNNGTLAYSGPSPTPVASATASVIALNTLVSSSTFTTSVPSAIASVIVPTINIINSKLTLPVVDIFTHHQLLSQLVFYKILR